MIRLLFDADAIRPPLTGIGYYALALAREFSRLSTDIELHCLQWGRLTELEYVERGLCQPVNPLAKAGRLPFKPLLRATYQRFKRLSLRRVLAERAADHILHTPNFIALPYDGPLVTTVHDLSCFEFPECHPAHRVRWLERELPHTLERAGRVITVSEHVRKQLLDRFSLPEDKVVAVLNGYDPAFCPRPPAALAMLRERWKLPEHYLLTVGTLEPRKNLERLLEAYLGLPRADRERCPLVLAGGNGWNDETLLARLGDAERDGTVRRLGYVPQTDLPGIVAGARGFVLVSLDEGFGLPLIEAMACGVPCLTSNCSALPEVAAGAAWLVEPRDVDAIRDGLRILLDDETWCEHARRHSLARAAQLGWAQCARETLAVYRALAPGEI